MSGVKIVLNAVIWTPRQLLGNVRPLIAKLLVQIKNFLLFFPIYWVFLDIRVQMIMPPDRKFKLVWFNGIYEALISKYSDAKNFANLTFHGIVFLFYL